MDISDFGSAILSMVVNIVEKRSTSITLGSLPLEGQFPSPTVVTWQMAIENLIDHLGLNSVRNLGALHFIAGSKFWSLSVAMGVLFDDCIVYI